MTAWQRRVVLSQLPFFLKWHPLGPTLGGATKQVMCDHLHPIIGSVRARPVRPGERVPRWRRQGLGPEDRRGVEDEVPFWARIDRRGPLLGMLAPLPGGSGRHDFNARDWRWITVIFPTNQARNAVSVFDIQAGEHPVFGFDHDPVATTINRLDVPRTSKYPSSGPRSGNGPCSFSRRTA